MSSEIAVKLILDSSTQSWSDEIYAVLETASVQDITELGHCYFAWTDDAWSTLGHEDLRPLHEWMDIESCKELLDIRFQYVCLVKDDTYLTAAGNPYYGIKVAFTGQQL